MRLSMKPMSPAIQKHRERVIQTLANEQTHTLNIKDTCQLSNGGIIDLEKINLANQAAKDFVAFTPAAGAASRYVKPYSQLINALHTKDIVTCQTELKKIANALQNCPLPPAIAKFTTEPLGQNDLTALEETITLPKALQPCVLEGNSFLEVKVLEHKKITGLDHQTFIVPDGMIDKFTSVFAEQASKISTQLLEQGELLSTWRFLGNGETFRDEQDQPSQVPGGHGLLVRLFPAVKDFFPTAKSLLIRNIDNIQGSKTAASNATTRFMQLHTRLLGLIENIRIELENENPAQANEHAFTILECLNLKPNMTLKEGLAALWAVQTNIFHSPIELLQKNSNFETLQYLYARPLNILGQVPNSGKDVGGAPCFIEYQGHRVKVCLEVPHASVEDKKTFLEDANKANFFNPVFIAAELTKNNKAYENDHPFWLIAAKSFQAQSVYYHEELLSEILGNSMTCNTIFTSLPRAVFNPHKTILDSQGKRLSDWF